MLYHSQPLLLYSTFLLNIKTSCQQEITNFINRFLYLWANIWLELKSLEKKKREQSKQLACFINFRQL